MSNYFSAHTHSSFSAIDGMSKVPDLVAKAHKLGHPGFALTDHGSMAGTVQAYKATQQYGMKFFPGVEGYLIDPLYEGNLKDSGTADRYHMGLLALNERGYKGLVALVSKSHTRPRFNRFPRLALSDLAAFGKEFGNDVVITTGCFFGWYQQTLVNHSVEKANRVIEAYTKMFPHVFVEVQHHNITHDHEVDSDANVYSDDEIVAMTIEAASNLDLPVIATQDSHYTDQKQKTAHALMKRMTFGGVDNEFPGDSFHLASSDWVREHYTDAQWALFEDGYSELLDLNDLRIAPLDTYKPDVPTVSDTEQEDLSRWARKALVKYLRTIGIDKGTPKYKRYRARLKYELEVIEDLSMAGYFLIALDFVQWCHRRQIAIEARGSASGSLVNYLIGVTQTDPIIWKLDFERFLSRDRTKPPDIDFDIEDVRRGEALAYLIGKYGAQQIGTWCLEPNARVLKADLTWAPVSDLKQGDEVVAFDEQVNGYPVGGASAFRTAEVTENNLTRRRSIKMTTDRGEVVASREHMWVVTRAKSRQGGYRQWVQTCDLEVGDQILYFCDPWESEQTWEAGWLAGFMDGEGFVCGGSYSTRRLRVAQAVGPLADKYQQLMTDREFQIDTFEKQKTLGTKDVLNMDVAGGMAETMRALGTIRPERLLKNFGHIWEGRRTYGKSGVPVATVQSLEPIGTQDVYAIGTTTGTLIAEGMFSHNSKMGTSYDPETGEEKGSILQSWIQGKRRQCEDAAWEAEKQKAERQNRKPVKYKAMDIGRSQFARNFGWVKSIDQVKRVAPKDYRGLRQLSQMRVFRSHGVHPGGVLLDGDTIKINDYVPRMLVASSDTIVTQFDMDDVEELGLVKLDILGQTSLSAMRTCQELMGRERPRDFTWIPEGDHDALRACRSGEMNTGIFHQEGYAKSKGCKELGVRSMHDLVLMQALYMPGCLDIAPGQRMSQKDVYLERRRNPEKRARVRYINDDFEAELKETFGAVVFQEQVINIMRRLGMDIAGINKFFKVVKDSGKGAIERNEERMAEVRAQFDDLCESAGIDSDEAWGQTAAFVAYGFNRAHATAYGLRTYRTAYLKTHYPLEYMTALLAVWGGTKKETVYMREARKRGIRILPPDVNESEANWTMIRDRNAIRRGLINVKGVGLSTAQKIHERAPFKDVEDFCRRVKVSGTIAYREDGEIKGVVLALKQAGALGTLGMKADDDE